MENNRQFQTYEETETLATELLREVKESAKRWFVAFLVVLFFWFTTIAIFFWYVTLPIEEQTVKIESDGGDDANYIGNDGDINNGTYYGNEDEESDPQA